jgi:hypothetical protein
MDIITYASIIGAPLAIMFLVFALVARAASYMASRSQRRENRIVTTLRRDAPNK